MVPDCSLWLVVFFMVPGQFYCFSPFQVWFFMVPSGYLWFLSVRGWFYCLFIVPDLFVRVPRRSLWLSRLQSFVPSQFFTVPGWFSFFHVFFHVFLMVLGQFSWFSWIKVGFLIIIGSRSVFHGSRLFFMVPGESSWFIMIPGWFYGFPSFQVGVNPSWAPEGRSETLGTPQKIPTWSVSWPPIPLGLAGSGLMMMTMLRRRKMWACSCVQLHTM